MTSLDDRLRDLLQAEGPDEAELQGDLGQVRAEVRRRTLRRRAVAGAAAAAIVAVGGLVLSQREGDDVRIDDIPPATTDQDPTTTTTAPRTSTTEDAGAGTNGSSTTSSTSSATSSTTSTTPPGPSMRDVDLESATFADACPGYDDGGRSATLQGGAASLPDGAGVTLGVELGPVGYGDVDADGDDDAVLLLRCQFRGAGTDNSGVLRAYRARPDGGIEQVGDGHLFINPRAPQQATAEGTRITVEVDIYADTDPNCCPSSAAREVWRFDGSGFVQESSTPIAPPGAG